MKRIPAPPTPRSAILGATPVNSRRTRKDAGRRVRSGLRIRVRWSQMDKAGDDEEFCESDATDTVLRFVEAEGTRGCVGPAWQVEAVVRISSVVEAEIQSALRRASKISRMRFSISPQRRKEASAPSSRETKVITPPAKFRSCHQTNFSRSANRRRSEEVAVVPHFATERRRSLSRFISVWSAAGRISMGPPRTTGCFDINWMAWFKSLASRMKNPANCSLVSA